MINKIIIIVGGLVIALFLMVILVRPQYQELQILNGDIAAKKTELSLRQAYFSQVKEISTRLREYPAALSKIADALPQNSLLASLANFLQTNSSQTGLILKKITLGGTTPPDEKKGSLAETQIAIQVSGSYQALKNFLAVVENSARMIEVQNLSIEIPAKPGDSPTFDLDFKVFSY